jgi:hypothetical protein
MVTVDSVTDDQTSLDRLIERVPPPKDPVFGSAGWEQLRSALGTALPSDYMRFLERYGSCEFGEWLGIADPRDVSAGFDIAQDAIRTGDEYRKLRDDHSDMYPLAAWPEPGGFLLWGSTIDGDDIGWLAEGEPDDWPVIILPRHFDQGPPIPVTMTEFLLSWSMGNTFDRPELPDLGETHCHAWK